MKLKIILGSSYLPGDKWKLLCKYNDFIIDTNIIPIKVPMNFNYMLEKEKFNFSELINHLDLMQNL